MAVVNKKIIKVLSISIVAFTLALVIPIIFPSEIAASTTSFTKHEFKMADDVHAILTFTFKTGKEKIDFPVFRITSDVIGNRGPTFEVQGIVGPNSFLQKAMDSTWEMRKVNLLPFNYEYKYFDVEVDITRGDSSVKKLKYSECRITDFRVDTLFDKEEGYTTEKTGFAIVDIINFECSGLNPSGPKSTISSNYDNTSQITDFGKHQYKTASDIHAITTFKFSDGTEKIDFPVFKTKSKYFSNVQPSFEVQGTVNSYPLLNKAINIAIRNGVNDDAVNMGQEYFSVDVELQKADNKIRTLQYSDCRISAYKIDTEFNKEEGFTKKNGFAIVDILGVMCNGLTTKSLNESSNGIVTQNTKKFSLEHLNNQNLMVNDLHAVATFIHRDGTEKIDFQVFKQTGKVLTTSNPTFELQSVVDSHPLLQRYVDETKSRGPLNDGYLKGMEFINVRIDLERSGEVLRAFEYSGCRLTDYQIDTLSDVDESYFGKTGFAMTNNYSFECQGYKPINPTYEAMYNIKDKRKTQSSLEIINQSFDKWNDNFILEKTPNN